MLKRVAKENKGATSSNRDLVIPLESQSNFLTCFNKYFNKLEYQRWRIPILKSSARDVITLSSSYVTVI